MKPLQETHERFSSQFPSPHDPDHHSDGSSKHVLVDTHPHVAQLASGEALFIPSQWYHYVDHQGDFNVNVTCWFVAESPQKTQDQKIIHPYEKPGQSCRDWRLVSRLVLSFIIALILQLVSRLTRSQVGHRFCDRQLARTTQS